MIIEERKKKRRPVRIVHSTHSQENLFKSCVEDKQFVPDTKTLPPPYLEEAEENLDCIVED